MAKNGDLEAMPEVGRLEPEKAKAKRYAVQFQRNRSFDLYIGRKMWHFPPYGEEILTEAEVKSPDFIQMAELFSMREVK